MLMLAGVCVAIGLAPVLFWPAVSRAVGDWHPAWASEETPAPLSALSSAQVALAILTVAAAAWLWRTARANGLRRGVTWDCGYSAPAARMQYTSGSFAGITAGWFRWILRPERKQRRPRGFFPTEAIRLERVPETVLERIIAPASVVILRVSTAVRRLQHGRLQAYILYMLAGLLAMGIVVLLGGKR
jgi:hydrogenase-4 component B